MICGDVVNIAIDLWGYNLLQQWNTQIKHLPLEANHKLTYVSGENIRRFYKEQSPNISVIQEQGKIAAIISKVPTALTLKLLTNMYGLSNDV